jgi:uncharacterized membrane protein YecN with MAPEG domain
MFDDSVKNYIEYKYVTYTDDGDVLTEVRRRIFGDDTEYLPNILREFTYFLHGLTFTYIDEVVAKSENCEHSSEDD